MTQKPNKIEQITKYLKHDIWQIRLAELSKNKARQIQILRILVFSGEKFQKDNLAHAASAMTFFTLLSIIPVLAMIFGIATMFVTNQEVENFIRQKLEGQEAIAEKMILYAQSMLENSQGGLIAGIGFLTLAYSVFKLLNNIEIVFNTIWEVDKQRTILRKITDYLTLTILSPIMILLVQALNIIGSQINDIAHAYEITPEITALISFATGLLPYTFLWLLFTLLYTVMPNYNVKIRSAFIGGVIAGSAYQLVQWVYFEFQVGASGANAVYGSFAALPLFLAQLQLGWMLILLGCMLSYAVQNIHRFERYSPEHRVSEAENKALIALVLYEISKHFADKNFPLTLLEIAEKTDIPIRRTEQLIELLVESQVLTEVDVEAKKEKGYQPAMDTDNYSLHFVHEIAEHFGDENLLIEKNTHYPRLKLLSEEVHKEGKKSEANILLKNS